MEARHLCYKYGQQKGHTMMGLLGILSILMIDCVGWMIHQPSHEGFGWGTKSKQGYLIWWATLVVR
jgi:hypothetical protein